MQSKLRQRYKKNQLGVDTLKETKARNKAFVDDFIRVTKKVFDPKNPAISALEKMSIMEEKDSITKSNKIIYKDGPRQRMLR